MKPKKLFTIAAQHRLFLFNSIKIETKRLACWKLLIKYSFFLILSHLIFAGCKKNEQVAPVIEKNLWGK